MESFYNIKIFLSGRCYSVQAFWKAMHGQTGHRQAGSGRAHAPKYERRARTSLEYIKTI